MRPRFDTRHILLAALLCAAATGVRAQTTISGVVNTCTAVLGVDGCNKSVAVESANGFSYGDLVLLIQMKGAEIGTTDDNTFGGVTSYNSAGKYELAEIDYIYGNTITFVDDLVNSYDVGAAKQLVRVPKYNNVTVDGVLQGCAWNGAAGGVIAIFDSGTVTLKADVDAAGIGFRGGEASQINAAFGKTGYRYAWSTGFGGGKGEGIAVATPDYDAGRGKLADGGGGGNSRNAGGGGGGNRGAGGKGGKESPPSVGTPQDNGGVGGAALTSSTSGDRIYLGGGGGGGHQNDDRDCHGAVGGGIVIIRAETLKVAVASRTINASGKQPTLCNDDGAGGGGAGGTVLLDVGTIVLDPSTTFTVNVKGGDGGYCSPTSPSTDQFGPGGGGGGGMVWQSGTTFSGSITVQAQGGLPGKWNNLNFRGATAGANGSSSAGLQIPQGP